jgi:putative PEP-CTERM system TPR-repeat lipoprotein
MREIRTTPVGRRGLNAALLLALVTLIAGCAFDAESRKQRYFESGNKYFAEGKYSHAAIEYQNALGIDATFGEARKQLALSHARIGDITRAREEYVRAADVLTQDVNLQLTAGAYLLSAGQAQEAAARADIALKLDPNNIQAHLLRGNALAGLRSFDEAIEAVEQAIRLDPSRGATLTHLGRLELAQGRQVEAEGALKKAVSLSPNAIETHLALGSFYWATNRPVEAEAAFRDALRLQPESIDANRAMAAMMLATGKGGEAESYLVRIADTTKNPGAVLMLADYYIVSGQAKQAITRLESIGAESRNTAFDERLARAYAVAGDRAKAKAILDETLTRDPASVSALLLKGQLLVDEGKRDDAFATIRAAATADPASADAQFALGKQYAERGDNAAAETAFREVLRINPRAAAAQVEIGRLELLAGDAKQAVRTAEEASRNQPGSLSARVMLVRGLLASRDLVRAEREIAVLRKAFPMASTVHTQAGTLALLRNDAPGARAAFERAGSLDPRALDALAGLVAVDIKAGDNRAATARLEERIKADPSAEVFMLAGRTYWTIGNLASAEQSFKQAIEVNPSVLAPYSMLGRLYVEQRKLDQALAEFDALSKRQSKPVGALTMSGIILQAKGNLPEARRRFEDALSLDSRAGIAANNLAWLHAESGENLDEALQLAQTATAATPDTPAYMDTLGWVYYKKRLPQMAIPLFTRCVEKVPAHGPYSYHLGLALMQAGEVERAKTAFQTALKAGVGTTAAEDIRRILNSNASAATH